jgi:hypothetical protein
LLVPAKPDVFAASFLAGDANLTFKGDKNSVVGEFTMFGKTFIRAQ